MDLKQRKHWRTRTDYEHRFTYNGFLTCSICREVISTALARRGIYILRKGDEPHTICQTKYIGRGKLERVLDGLFADRLTKPAFLRNCIQKRYGNAPSRLAMALTSREINSRAQGAPAQTEDEGDRRFRGGGNHA